MSSILNPKRLINQISLNLQLRSKSYALIIIIGLIFIIFQFFNKDFNIGTFLSSQITGTRFFTNSTSIDIHKFHFNWFPIFFLFLSSIITSISFSEFQENTSRTFHLAIPSTIFEKWFSKVLIALILSPLIIIFLYQSFIWVSMYWPSVDSYYQVPTGVLDPFFRPIIIKTILIQGVIILGATLYKKQSLAKTLVTILCIIVAYNIILIVSLSLFGGGSSLFSNFSIYSLMNPDLLIEEANQVSRNRDFSFLNTFLV